MFVFTLVQSRTHVDTVQNVSHFVTNSKHICWSHTMKVLGWHVTFVRKSSAAVVTLRNMYLDMKVWSRMFVVNVRSVSVHHLNWRTICQYIWTTNSFVVIFVTTVSNVNMTLKSILRNVRLFMDLVSIKVSCESPGVTATTALSCASYGTTVWTTSACRLSSEQ